jgi:hypothetical protein
MPRGLRTNEAVRAIQASRTSPDLSPVFTLYYWSQRMRFAHPLHQQWKACNIFRQHLMRSYGSGPAGTTWIRVVSIGKPFGFCSGTHAACGSNGSGHVSGVGQAMASRNSNP